LLALVYPAELRHFQYSAMPAKLAPWTELPPYTKNKALCVQDGSTSSPRLLTAVWIKKNAVNSNSTFWILLALIFSCLLGPLASALPADEVDQDQELFAENFPPEFDAQL